MKRIISLLLTLVLAALLVCFALAVPCGALDQDAADRYREEQSAEGDDSWLLDY